jgi:hypothetical protein
MTRLLDAYAPEFDVSGTQVVLVDADPPIVRAALDLHRPAIPPLGLGERLALAPALLETRGHERVYGLIWRLAAGPAALPSSFDGFARPGHVKVVWDVQVEAGGESGAVLASTMRFTATDDQAREHLLDAWGLVGAVSTALTKRALTRVKRRAEAYEPGIEALALAA